jgi:hypothetical protein
MAFKLMASAQARRRAVNAPHLVALVRAGAVFKNGKLIERPDELGGSDRQVARHPDPLTHRPPCPPPSCVPPPRYAYPQPLTRVTIVI